MLKSAAWILLFLLHCAMPVLTIKIRVFNSYIESPKLHTLYSFAHISTVSFLPEHGESCTKLVSLFHLIHIHSIMSKGRELKGKGTMVASSSYFLNHHFQTKWLAGIR